MSTAQRPSHRLSFAWMGSQGPQCDVADTGCGLYVHVPFCLTKCGYCDFYSVPLKNRDPAPVVERMIRELSQRIGHCSLTVETIFFGGGTPTLLPYPLLQELLAAVDSTVDLTTVREFTVEANPASIDASKAQLLSRSGVNRVSVGAQSFFASELAALERLHSPHDIALSVDVLRHNGISHINLDLIFGIPGQTLDSWGESLHKAVALEPDHIACYGLTYESGTRLTAQRRTGAVVPCAESLEAEMYELAMDRLPQAGYCQYELSNYAKPGRESAHNINYWRNGPYIGVGPSAAGCVSGCRYKNVSDMARYVRMIDECEHAIEFEETLDADAVILETIMMQMRLSHGMSIASFTARTGRDAVAYFGESLMSLEKQGLLRLGDGYIALTRRGRLVADAVIRELAAA